MAPAFVKPHIKTTKQDYNDAEAICEAVARPNMRFVPVKSPDEKALPAVHCARSGWVKAGTAQANQIRGLLGELGIVVAKGITGLRAQLPHSLGDADNGLPGPLSNGTWYHPALDAQRPCSAAHYSKRSAAVVRPPEHEYR